MFVDPSCNLFWKVKEVEIKSSEFIKEKTGNLMPNIPGFDIGNLFK